VGELLRTLGRHNARPSHLHVVIDAPGFHKLTTALYPEGDPYLSSDVIFGAKKSLVVVSMHHLLVGVAWAPVVRVIPRRVHAIFLPFLSFSLPCKAEFFSVLDRNSLKSMTKPRHESADFRTVPTSSCLLMTLSSSPRTNGK